MKRKLAVARPTANWMPYELISRLVLTAFDHTLMGLAQLGALLELRLIDREWARTIRFPLLGQFRCTDCAVLKAIAFSTHPDLFGVDSRQCDVPSTLAYLFRGCETLYINQHRVPEWLVTAVPLMPVLHSLWVETAGRWPTDWDKPDALNRLRRLCVAQVNQYTSITLPAQLETLWDLAMGKTHVVAKTHLDAHRALKHYVGPYRKDEVMCPTLESHGEFSRLPVNSRNPTMRKLAKNAFMAGRNELVSKRRRLIGRLL